MLYLDAIEVNPHMSRDKAENIILKFVDDKWLTRDVRQMIFVKLNHVLTFFQWWRASTGIEGEIGIASLPGRGLW